MVLVHNEAVQFSNRELIFISFRAFNYVKQRTMFTISLDGINASAMFAFGYAYDVTM